MNDYTIIEDVFGDDDNRNQITAARGFLGKSHIPDDLRPKRSRGERPDIPDLTNFQRPQPGVQPEYRDSMGGIQEQMIPSMNMMIPQGPTVYPGVDSLQCRDVFTHVENCPICSSYFKKDVKFYWLIIGILVVIILLLTRK